MKRAAATVIFLGALALAGGCQSSSGDGCYGAGSCCNHESDACAPGFVCDQQSGECLPVNGGNGSCRAPADCPASFTCGENAQCMPGDCYFHGCVAGFECQSSTGTWQCAPPTNGSAGASNEDTTDTSSGGVPEAAGQSG